MSETKAPAPQRSPLTGSLVASRRPALAAGALLLAVGGGWYMMTHEHRQKPVSAALPTPTLAAPAGGDNHSPLLDATALRKEREDAEAAKKSGRSYAAPLSSDRGFADDHAPTMGEAPNGKPRHVSSTAEQKPEARPASPQNPAPSGPRDAVANVFTRNPDSGSAPRSGQASRVVRADGMSEAEEVELIAAWSGRPPSLDMEMPAGGTAREKQAPRDSSFAQAPQGSAETDATAAARSAPGTEATSASKPSRRLILAAGRGVYAHAVLAANSDIGGAALVEVDSGPLAHDRLSGTFERKDERLVIKFDKLMIGDADPIPVSAYAVSPDTAEAGVASEVREHLLTRTILPAAAAFVEGLGNAMENTNTNSVTSGLGVSSFTHLTLPQQMGVAAGRAGQAMGQILQQQTPQQPTVILHKDDPVGVMFSDPVYAP